MPTLADLEAITGETLKTADVAAYLNACPNTINNAAKMGVLPWAYKLGSRTIIPKDAFIHYHKYGQVLMRPQTESQGKSTG